MQKFSVWMINVWWIFPLATLLFSFFSVFTIDVSGIVFILFGSLSIVMLLLQLLIFIVFLIRKKWGRSVEAFLLLIFGIIIVFFICPILILGHGYAG